jgi:hypothetical protein
MTPLTAPDIEILIARHFNYRTNIIVPNVSWGLGLLYEADLVVLRPSGYAVEVEIKISRSDIKADLNKRHCHDSIYFRELYFAVPSDIADDPNIPERAGILAIGTSKNGVETIKKMRPAKIYKQAKRWDQKKIDKLLHLGSMRIWGLKENLKAQKMRWTSFK